MHIVCMYALQCWRLTLGPHACWVSTLSLYTTCLNCSFISRVFHLPVYIRLNHSQTIDSESCSPSAHCLYATFVAQQIVILCAWLWRPPLGSPLFRLEGVEISQAPVHFWAFTLTLLECPTPYSPACLLQALLSPQTSLTTLLFLVFFFPFLLFF